MNGTVHVALYDTLADWEIGHLLVELRTGRFTGNPWTVVTVAETAEPVTTMGGLHLIPEIALADLDAMHSDLLVLPGAEMWDAGGGERWAGIARRFLEAQVPVAAICGATAGLARAGLLNDRKHTSAALDYLAAQPGYDGSDHYVEARAVISEGLVTAGPQSPVQFARATLELLGLAPAETLEAYEAVFHRGDPTAFPVLMQAELMQAGGVA
jgi:putative intracellular protease/amidase